MPSSATSRPNLRSARIVDCRSWIADVRYSHLPKEGRNPFAQCHWKAHARHKLAPSSSHSHRRTDCLGAIRDALRVIFQACVCRHLDSAAPCFNNRRSSISSPPASPSPPTASPSLLSLSASQIFSISASTSMSAASSNSPPTAPSPADLMPNVCYLGLTPFTASIAPRASAGDLDLKRF